MGILDRIIAESQKNTKTIVLPESRDIRTIKAAARIMEQKIAEVVLLGNPADVRSLADSAGVAGIAGARIVDWKNSASFAGYAEALYELRKPKGMTPDGASALLENPLYYGVMMVKQGDADGMVAGAQNSTADTLRPALQILKTAPGVKTVSSFFLVEAPGSGLGSDGVFVFADCALMECPTAEELSEIAIAAAESFRAFVGQEPVVAMLSYSTFGSAKSDHTAKVAEATRIAKGKAPKLLLDGEMQLDAAIVEEVGRLKAPGSKVAGKANVLVFPDLNSGNIGYKLAQRLGNAAAYGPIMQGLAKPVNDLSRGCSAEDIVGVVACTALQAARQP